jgi:dihydrofolate synthase/folylpolyglutamate synthase
MRMGLERMGHFLETLGSPHLAVPVIHVAGTNGKGGTVRMIASILRAGGYRVGEYTSPHLQHVNERIQVCGVSISDADLDRLLTEVDGARQRWAAGLDDFVPIDRVLTYFELMTAAAFLHFANQDLDVVVIEVGLGGRLDATNVVDPLITAISSVGLDHTEELGPDLASIAGEKAGIIKAGRPVVVGAMDAQALRVIRAISHERSAELISNDGGWGVEIGREGVFSWSFRGHTEHGLRVALRGDHQVLNAGVALTVIAQISDRFPIPNWGDVLKGLAAVKHPGRLEQCGPELLVDCAHNVQGAAALATYLMELPRTQARTLLLGTSSDKDPRAMIIPLVSHVDRVLTTHCSHPRATPAGALAQQLIDIKIPVLPAGPIEEALAMAQAGGGMVIVTGSVFLAGAVRELAGSR